MLMSNRQGGSVFPSSSAAAEEHSGRGSRNGGVAKTSLGTPSRREVADRPSRQEIEYVPQDRACPACKCASPTGPFELMVGDVYSFRAGHAPIFPSYGWPSSVRNRRRFENPIAETVGEDDLRRSISAMA